jgi:hypothetical protein
VAASATLAGSSADSNWAAPTEHTLPDKDERPACAWLPVAGEIGITATAAGAGGRAVASAPEAELVGANELERQWRFMPHSPLAIG